MAASARNRNDIRDYRLGKAATLPPGNTNAFFWRDLRSDSPRSGTERAVPERPCLRSSWLRSSRPAPSTTALLRFLGSLALRASRTGFLLGLRARLGFCLGLPFRLRFGLCFGLRFGLRLGLRLGFRLVARLPLRDRRSRTLRLFRLVGFRL